MALHYITSHRITPPGGIEVPFVGLFVANVDAAAANLLNSTLN